MSVVPLLGVRRLQAVCRAVEVKRRAVRQEERERGGHVAEPALVRRHVGEAVPHAVDVLRELFLRLCRILRRLDAGDRHRLERIERPGRFGHAPLHDVEGRRRIDAVLPDRLDARREAGREVRHADRRQATGVAVVEGRAQRPRPLPDVLDGEGAADVLRNRVAPSGLEDVVARQLPARGEREKVVAPADEAVDDAGAVRVLQQGERAHDALAVLRRHRENRAADGRGLARQAHERDEWIRRRERARKGVRLRQLPARLQLEGEVVEDEPLQEPSRLRRECPRVARRQLRVGRVETREQRRGLSVGLLIAQEGGVVEEATQTAFPHLHVVVEGLQIRAARRLKLLHPHKASRLGRRQAQPLRQAREVPHVIVVLRRVGEGGDARGERLDGERAVRGDGEREVEALGRARAERLPPALAVEDGRQRDFGLVGEAERTVGFFREGERARAAVRLGQREAVEALFVREHADLPMEGDLLRLLAAERDDPLGAGLEIAGEVRERRRVVVRDIARNLVLGRRDVVRETHPVREGDAEAAHDVLVEDRRQAVRLSAHLRAFVCVDIPQAVGDVRAHACGEGRVVLQDGKAAHLLHQPGDGGIGRAYQEAPLRREGEGRRRQARRVQKRPSDGRREVGAGGVRRAQGVGEGARGGEQRRRARVARLLAETGELEAARGHQRVGKRRLRVGGEARAHCLRERGARLVGASRGSGHLRLVGERHRVRDGRQRAEERGACDTRLPEAVRKGERRERLRRDVRGGLRETRLEGVVGGRLRRRRLGRRERGGVGVQMAQRPSLRLVIAVRRRLDGVEDVDDVSREAARGEGAHVSVRLRRVGLHQVVEEARHHLGMRLHARRARDVVRVVQKVERAGAQVDGVQFARRVEVGEDAANRVRLDELRGVEPVEELARPLLDAAEARIGDDGLADGRECLAVRIRRAARAERAAEAQGQAAAFEALRLGVQHDGLVFGEVPQGVDGDGHGGVPFHSRVRRTPARRVP